MAKSALGYHWKQITPAQQQEFTDGVRRIYRGLLPEQDQRLPRPAGRLPESRPTTAPQYAQVNTDIVQPGQGSDPRELPPAAEGDTWKIYDVTVDAISIIANYRNQFNRVMNNQGYDTLIADLKSKQAALAASLANH